LEVFKCVDRGSDKVSEVRRRGRSVEGESRENVRLKKKKKTDRAL
jgi:hypothetical protein